MNVKHSVIQSIFRNGCIYDIILADLIVTDRLNRRNRKLRDTYDVRNVQTALIPTLKIAIV